MGTKPVYALAGLMLVGLLSAGCRSSQPYGGGGFDRTPSVIGQNSNPYSQPTALGNRPQNGAYANMPSNGTAAYQPGPVNGGVVTYPNTPHGGAPSTYTNGHGPAPAPSYMPPAGTPTYTNMPSSNPAAPGVPSGPATQTYSVPSSSGGYGSAPTYSTTPAPAPAPTVPVVTPDTTRYTPAVPSTSLSNSTAQPIYSVPSKSASEQ